MIRFAVAAVFLVTATALSAPVPKEGPKPTGVFVLDNCDPDFRGKDKYADNLTFYDGDAKPKFQITGFNNCETVGCSRMVTVDSDRKCVWTLENVAHRLRRFDLTTGKETLTVEGVHGLAVAVEPETGNVWVRESQGRLNSGKTVVYDAKGKEVASYDITGWDMVYDKKAKAFWIAGQKLTKITAEKGEVAFSVDIASWGAVSVDVDPKSGAAWVAIREQPKARGNTNELLKIDADGKELLRIDLGVNYPFKVSADPTDGGVWVARMRRAVEKFSADGKSEAVHAVDALAVQVDPAGGDVWVVTPEEVQRLNAKGEVTARVKHPAKTSQAWIAAVE